MRTVMTALAVLALGGCERAEQPATVNTADANVAAEANVAADANATVTPAAFEINRTTWQFTEDGVATTETIDSDGNYVAWSDDGHLDHGTVVMKGDKACFTSEAGDDGEVCWTTQPGIEISDSMEITSDRGQKLTVTRIAYMEPPESVRP